ncbi:hypothetical protein EGW08_019710 [Elysia chlorotica]|uniref:Uncharacterized protein n=1 Tax=Elysia chlorotica TaxID=188477 RepID=A0A433STE2_ELYCH|nr:hypothetical protein EGW08_019710 [Elysia chlorotica]
MKSNRSISKRQMDELDEHLAGQDFSQDSNNGQCLWDLRQYVSPSCYGHNLQKCNIQLPRIPKCFTDQEHQDSNDTSKKAPLSDEACPLLKWSVLPPDVVQLGGLPTDCDIELWRDVVASHGTILKSEVQKTNRETFLRFKLSNPESCDWLVSNIDKVDFLGTGQKIKCSHLMS